MNVIECFDCHNPIMVHHAYIEGDHYYCYQCHKQFVDESSMTWNTIDTAPRNGRRILVWDGINVVVAEYRTEMFVGNQRSDTKHWIQIDTYQDEMGGEVLLDPTHWMPLPNPPA